MLSSTRVSAMADTTDPMPRPRSGARIILGSLLRDRFALVSAVFLALVLVCALVGPTLFAEQARALYLRGRNMAPFSLDAGWMFVLGGDALGRSLLARIIVASQNTLLIAPSAVAISVLVGGSWALSRAIAAAGWARCCCAWPMRS